jgi:hypothetical protein
MRRLLLRLVMLIGEVTLLLFLCGRTTASDKQTPRNDRATPAAAKPATGVTWTNYDKVHKGMARSNVEKLLGKYDTYYCEYWENAKTGVTFYIDRLTWRAKGITIIVRCRAGKVLSKSIEYRVEWGFPDSLRRLLPW